MRRLDDVGAVSRAEKHPPGRGGVRALACNGAIAQGTPHALREHTPSHSEYHVRRRKSSRRKTECLHRQRTTSIDTEDAKTKFASKLTITVKKQHRKYRVDEEDAEI
jgi:hypothetical protein